MPRRYNVQRKWSFIAVALVVLSAVSVFSVIELSDTGAETGTSDPNRIVFNANVNDRHLFNIMINENYFELVDPDHSVVWSYAVSGSSGTPVYYSLNLNQPVIRDDFTFEVEQVMSDDETAVIGNYQLVVEPHQSAQVTLTLKYEIDHKYGKDDNNEMITEPLYLVYNMALMNHAVMPTSLEYLLEFRGTTQTILSNEGFHFEQGVHTKLRSSESLADCQLDES